MAVIAGIKRFEIHDGDGIRTTVFLKGCPLSCKWCHNPECISYRPEIAFYEQKCINCGRCASICSCHIINNGIHYYDRNKCNSCGRCVEGCPKGALVLYGKDYSIEQLMPILLEDQCFFERSGGGVTVSGGEPLSQPVFCTELLSELKAHGINTAVDTSGAVPRHAIEMVFPFADAFLYDIKATDEQLHIQYTGMSNLNIIQNLEWLLEREKKVEIRIPLIPTINDNQIYGIGELLQSFHFSGTIKVLPYHNYAISKYNSLNKTYDLFKVPRADDDMVERAVCLLKTYGLCAVNGGK